MTGWGWDEARGCASWCCGRVGRDGERQGTRAGSTPKGLVRPTFCRVRYADRVSVEVIGRYVGIGPAWSAQRTLRRSYAAAWRWSSSLSEFLNEPSSATSSNLTARRFETPDSSMVTPYSKSATCMVGLR